MVTEETLPSEHKDESNPVLTPEQAANLKEKLKTEKHLKKL